MTKLFTAAEFGELFASYVGLPYVLGQPVPHKGGKLKAADCSGMIIHGLNASGAFVMGDDTAAGLYNRSKAVTGEPAVGDMVFLRNNPARSNGIGHVAVLTAKLSNGDWRIVEARGRASGVVNTTLSYWKTRRYYTGIRRLPSFTLAATPAPKPVKTLAQPWIVTYNCQSPRWGGKVADGAKLVNTATASVYLLTEAPESVRTALRKSRPGGTARWKVWERGEQAILFDSTKWGWTTSRKVQLGTAYHGAVVAVLTHKATGLRVQFVAVHLPPKSAGWTDTQRKALFDRLVGSLDSTLPIIVGGDLNSTAAESWARPYGFRAAPTGATADDGRRIDWLLIHDGTWTSATVHNPGAASDHRAIRAHARIAAPSPL